MIVRRTPPQRLPSLLLALTGLALMSFPSTTHAQTADAFPVGSRITVTNPSGASVYAGPSTSERFLNPQWANGSIVAGPTPNGGDTWWMVDFDLSNDGWVRESEIAAIAPDTIKPPPPTNFAAVPVSVNQINLW